MSLPQDVAEQFCREIEVAPLVLCYSLLLLSLYPGPSSLSGGQIVQEGVGPQVSGIHALSYGGPTAVFWYHLVLA